MWYLAAFVAALAVDSIPVFAPLHGKVSWQTAVTAAAGLLLISGVLFVDWPELLGHKRLRLNFAIWK